MDGLNRICKPDGPLDAKVAFVGSGPDVTDAIRGRPLTGPSGETFRDVYLKELEMRRSDVLLLNLVPDAKTDETGDYREPTQEEIDEHIGDVLETLKAVEHVIALGRTAKNALGEAADTWLPHPIATRYYGPRAEIGRKLRKVKYAIRRQPDVGKANVERRAEIIRKRVGAKDLRTVTEYIMPLITAGEAGSSSGYVQISYTSPTQSTFTWTDEYGNQRSDTQSVDEQLFVNAQILKAEQEQQLVTGIVMEPGEFDAHGDVTTADEIERAAHMYLLNSRVVGEQHSKPAPAYVVESWIAPSDMTVGEQDVKAGSWLMTVKVDDEEMWGQVKSGDFTGFSIGGFAQKV